VGPGSGARGVPQRHRRVRRPPTPLPPDTNEPPAKDNGTHSGINRKPAALRMVQRFLLPPDRQAADRCALAGSPAPCDCGAGACD
jgi:hypothetical protein